jgi:hypothetical protein
LEYGFDPALIAHCLSLSRVGLERMGERSMPEHSQLVALLFFIPSLVASKLLLKLLDPLDQCGLLLSGSKDAPLQFDNYGFRTVASLTSFNALKAPTQ